VFPTLISGSKRNHCKSQPGFYPQISKDIGRDGDPKTQSKPGSLW